MNDADRVLEIYQWPVRHWTVRDAGQLDRDLAQVVSQPDPPSPAVRARFRLTSLQLAARFAENFATTVEGRQRARLAADAQAKRRPLSALCSAVYWCC